MSRQRNWQKKCRDNNLCIQCGEPVYTKSNGRAAAHCIDCAVVNRERLRTLRGYQRRNENAASYLREKSE
jgi:hypothetical protein